MKKTISLFANITAAIFIVFGTAGCKKSGTSSGQTYQPVVMTDGAAAKDSTTITA